jgi:hypothetical protein
MFADIDGEAIAILGDGKGGLNGKSAMRRFPSAHATITGWERNNKGLGVNANA